MYSLILVTILPLLLMNIQQQGVIAPPEYFGDSYSEAVHYLNDNRIPFEKLGKKYGFDPTMAMAIVFPEVIRHNRFRDFAETSVLELAYVEGGKTVADFSVGKFQMKPSFVEMLEMIVATDSSYLEFKHICDYGGRNTQQSVRRERVGRLKQPGWQMEYLACFIKIGINQFKEKIEVNPDEELLILSSLYNLSLKASYEQVVQTSQQKTFPYGRLGTGRFSYFDVANHYYQEQIQKESKLRSKP